MEDISFKIQLGVILPKMTDEISDPILKIFDELVGFIKSAEASDDDINKEEIKEILMKDFEIFLDKKIIPKSRYLQQDQDAQEIDTIEDEAKTE
ncbi:MULTISPECIES: hypothetical protein [unclassified Francisella]|uniref:hypothetical protein n=1 Tax=unclassified Francisella TaxID=2610885 RepID=UPI002E3550DF|nr:MULTISPECIES: hypothetical protein [unclassified Francisella]MED7818908.1 hypothetical protein [Francisella sp. 19S2-4]MED7829745.1 hypothetical protein [Francisella sp. 19S2-10]